MRYKHLDKFGRLEVEIVHILVIITAMTQNHGNCRKSRHKAKITVITAIVNSWFTYIPTYAVCSRVNTRCNLDYEGLWTVVSNILIKWKRGENSDKLLRGDDFVEKCQLACVSHRQYVPVVCTIESAPNAAICSILTTILPSLWAAEQACRGYKLRCGHQMLQLAIYVNGTAPRHTCEKNAAVDASA